MWRRKTIWHNYNSIELTKNQWKCRCSWFFSTSDAIEVRDPQYWQSRVFWMCKRFIIAHVWWFHFQFDSTYWLLQYNKCLPCLQRKIHKFNIFFLRGSHAPPPPLPAALMSEGWDPWLLLYDLIWVFHCHIVLTHTLQLNPRGSLIIFNSHVSITICINYSMTFSYFNVAKRYRHYRYDMSKPIGPSDSQVGQNTITQLSLVIGTAVEVEFIEFLLRTTGDDFN